MTTIPALNISWSPASEIGTEGSPIALPGISIKGAPGGGLLSAIVSGLPAGAVLSDGHGHSFTAKAGSTSVDVHTWYLPGLSIVPPNDTDFILTFTGTDLLGRTASATQSVIVTPLAPALAPIAAAGVEGDAIALNLGVTVNSRSGDTNSLASLMVSAIPVGATLSDGTHSFKATSGNTSIDAHAWNLSSLTITPANNANFTLTLAATERDAQGDLSATTTATVAVAVKPAAPAIASFSPDTGVQGDGITSGNGAHAITLAGTADPGATVALYDGKTPVGTTVAAADGSWSIPTSSLADGKHSFTATATDAEGDTSPASPAFAVTIDTTPPKLTAVANQTDEATSAAGAPAFFAATATDLVDGTDPVVFKEGSTVIHSGDTFSLGTHTITASASDAAGNTASETFTIKVVDTTPPILSPIADQTDKATGPGGVSAFFAATATDQVDGTDPVVFKEGSTVVHSGDTFAIGTHTITAGASDAAGNTASETFTIKVLPSNSIPLTATICSMRSKRSRTL
jgi:hypothetical protein